MPENFVPVQRDQQFLLPPSVAEWLPEDHLAWFVVDVVDEFDLSAFLGVYRPDGRGGAAYHPAMMVALLVYAYAIGERSSRQIERRCIEDVAFRVLAANQQPDHATIARFRATHQTALAGLFGQVLRLCAKAGVLRPALLAIDGTKMAGNASMGANHTAEELAAAILADAAAVDAAENEAGSGERDHELPPQLRTRGPSRRARLRALLDELEAEAEAKSFETHLERRAAKQAATGRKPRGPAPTRESPKRRSRQQANLTDPESRLMKIRGGFIQGYNAQTVATEDQFVVAVQVTNHNDDTASFIPMIGLARANLRQAGERRRVRRVLADAGYWSESNVHLRGVETFIAPGRQRRLRAISDQDQRRGAVLDRVNNGELDRSEACTELGIGRVTLNALLRRRRDTGAESLTTCMVARLDTPRGRKNYRKRSAIIEPVFAQIKHNRRIRTFSRRGLASVDSEWHLICATHNLLKLWRLA